MKKTRISLEAIRISSFIIGELKTVKGGGSLITPCPTLHACKTDETPCIPLTDEMA